MQVVVDSLLTQYERVGKGKMVLVLHGWGDSAKGWRAFNQSLQDDYEMLVLDLPGMGGSEAPKQPWGLDEYADFVGAFLKKLQLKPFAIVGHSNGGAIALRGLARGAFSTERLVLLDSAGIRGQQRARTAAIRLATKVGKAVSTPLPKSVKRRLRRKLYQTVGSDMLVAEHLQETFKRVVTDDVQADAAKLHLPTLLIYGEDDLATPLHYGRLLHSLIDGSTLEIVPDAGHFVHLDKPEIVLKRITDFLT